MLAPRIIDKKYYVIRARTYSDYDRSSQHVLSRCRSQTLNHFLILHPLYSRLHYSHNHPFQPVALQNLRAKLPFDLLMNPPLGLICRLLRLALQLLGPRDPLL